MATTTSHRNVAPAADTPFLRGTEIGLVGLSEREVRDRAEALAASAREVAAATGRSDSWSAESRSAVLAALDATARALTAARTPVLVAQDRSGAWVAPGIRSFDDARSRDTRAGRGSARAELQDAHTLTELAGGAEALADGEITEGHVSRLRQHAAKLPPERRKDLLTHDAPQLLDLARQHDAPTFARKVEDLIAAKSPKDNQDDHDRLRAQRFLTVRDSAQGLHLSGLLDPVAGHTLRLALEAATPTPAADDTRSPAQRRADALTALAGHALDDGTFKPGAPQRPHVALTIDAETYAHALAHLRAGSHTARPTPSVPDELSELLLASAPSGVRLDDGPLVAPSELGRLLCTSELTRLVVGADSLPLDVGRSQRLYTGHLRRAVVARDQHCRWDGCSMPARHCEVHHIDWWDEDHGRTSVESGVLLCDFHHHEVHRRGLDVRRKRRVSSPGVPPGHGEYEPPEYEMTSRSLSRREREAATRRRLRQTLVDQGKIRPRPSEPDPPTGTADRARPRGPLAGRHGIRGQDGDDDEW